MPLAAIEHVNPVEARMLVVLLQLIVMIAAARLGGYLFSLMRQPQVVGEIAAGLFLGPSCLGRLNPELLASIFPKTVAPIFETMGQLGLIFLMFIIGMEFEFSHLRKLGKTALGIGLSGVLLPFFLALPLAIWMQPYVASDISAVGFSLFVATACTVTAIPILGRIMIEFGINRTRLGALTISAAALDDALIWIMLATVAAIVKGNFQLSNVAIMLLLAASFVAAVWLIARPLLIRWLNGVLKQNHETLPLVPLSFLLLIILAAAITSNWIGIFSIIGPFVLGASLFDQHKFREAFNSRTREFVYGLLLPVFFTYTGLRTDIGTLDSPQLWLFCGLIVLVAMTGKIVGCGLAAKVGGLSWPEAGCVAVMMNTRALMGLIAINVGRDLGVIPPSVFCMLIIMAVASTFMCSPLLALLLPKVKHLHD